MAANTKAIAVVFVAALTVYGVWRVHNRPAPLRSYDAGRGAADVLPPGVDVAEAPPIQPHDQTGVGDPPCPV